MGDGIGPEIMQATLDILQAAGARIQPEFIEIGEAVYGRGILTGIAEESWESLRRTRVFLKAPITTPQGGGFKSLNVTTRKTLGLFANVRPCVSYHPFVDTKHPNMDLVIIRENEEDLYAGIEHRQTHEVYQTLKLISRPGTEKIIRYAFEYAKSNGRKKVTCFTKDNIMKMTDGLFHKVFDEIGAEYPDIEKEHWIIDIGSAKMADTPEVFDVIVTLNLYGDIISDIAAQIAGSVGLAGSSNIGTDYAMFEAIHGSAPRRAGQNMANPTGLLNGAILMLQHIGQVDIAEKVQNALLKTLEDGIHTYDIYDEGKSSQKVGTREFAQAIIERLGQVPAKLKPAAFNKESKGFNRALYEWKPKDHSEKTLVGCDIFVHWAGQDIDSYVAEKLALINQAPNLEIALISNRGIKVWPNGNPSTFKTDHWRVRVKAKGAGASGQKIAVSAVDIAEIQVQLAKAGVDVIKTEGLYYFGDTPGFVKALNE
jgi:isocitrate dehydrogenase